MLFWGVYRCGYWFQKFAVPWACFLTSLWDFFGVISGLIYSLKSFNSMKSYSANIFHDKNLSFQRNIWTAYDRPDSHRLSYLEGLKHIYGNSILQIREDPTLIRFNLSAGNGPLLTRQYYFRNHFAKLESTRKEIFKILNFWYSEIKFDLQF